MVFSSPVFLFIFFPLFCVFYLFTPRRFRNSLVLLASLSFYVLGAGSLTLVAIVLLVTNWLLAILIGRFKNDPCRKHVATAIFVGTVAFDLTPLVFFKYFVFITQIISDLTRAPLLPDVGKWGIVLPLGISFYTFHFISYLADVHSGRIRPEASLQKFAIYIFLFPHLIAGPIVRFSEVRQQLDVKRRNLVKSDIFWGLVIFAIGLSKKILIADPLGAVVDVVHRPDVVLTTYSAWLSAICYSFQIYFDFSGYTDMAIGMARMLGFRFPRNFNRPYAAHTVTQFWQRWHMTLSRWFRDYVYIPLGGNRASTLTTYRNLFIVFGLCALWHGAAYTFLAWGFGHGILISMERAGILKVEKWGMGSIPVFIFATVLWVPFRAENIMHAGRFLKAMFGLNPTVPFWADANQALIDFKVIFLLILSGFICLIGDKLLYSLRGKAFRRPLVVGTCCFLFYTLSCISVVERGFNPFIYFQF